MMAVVYCPDCFERGNHRFVLEQPGEHMLLVIGLNPSMADGSHPDPTMQSVLRLTNDNGYDGYAMKNLSSERTTDKRNLALILDEAMHLQSLDVASKLLSRCPAADLLIAFGNGILIRPYLKDCFRDLYGILRGSKGR